MALIEFLFNWEIRTLTVYFVFGIRIKKKWTGFAVQVDFHRQKPK